MKIVDKFCERFADKIIWVFISLYAIIFSYLSFLKYYSFGYYDWDFASDISVLWNSIHGKIFYYPFLEQSIFGAHIYLIILLLIPVYMIFQHPLAILFLQSLFLGLAAYPLYLLAKSKLNRVFALMISLVYLLYPPVGFMNLFESHFEIYVIFFLFFALYYFEKEKFSKFLIFILLALSCKENVSFVVFMFGIYAFIRKRSKRWILTPLILGVVWFFTAVKIIIPYFAKDAKLYNEGFMFTAYYRHLGDNIFDMAKTIIMHPVLTIRYAFTAEKLFYIYDLFSPAGFIGFLSPAVLLIAFPVFLQNLLSSVATHTKIYYHYTALIIPFIFVSVVFAFKRLLNYNRVYKYRILLLFVFVVICASFSISLKAPQFYFLNYIKRYQINDLARQKKKLIEMIPREASVISTFQFLPQLAHRHDLSSMHLVSTGFRMYTNVAYQPPSGLEYALIDFNEPLMRNSFFPTQAPDNIRSFLEDGGWKVMGAVDDIILFKKNYPSGHKLVEMASEEDIDNPMHVNIAGQLTFLGYDVDEMNMDGDRILHFAYYWESI